jgi:hypothetical protein
MESNAKTQRRKERKVFLVKKRAVIHCLDGVYLSDNRHQGINNKICPLRLCVDFYVLTGYGKS